jgi:hypothetical protein
MDLIQHITDQAVIWSILFAIVVTGMFLMNMSE